LKACNLFAINYSLVGK